MYLKEQYKSELQNYTVHITHEFDLSVLSRGIYIVITEAKRIPPHIGMLIDGKYSSLTVKGNEIEIQAGVIFKNIMLRKVPSLFIKIKDHPVFSFSYLNELLFECVTEHERVEAEGATCLTPVKNFFKEGYQVSSVGINFLFDLLPALKAAELIQGTAAYNVEEEIKGGQFSLPTYTFNEINERIRQVRIEVTR